MKQLEPPNSHHLSAAAGWLGLGCAEDARAELAKVSPPHQNHPATLELRWLICAHERQWRDALAAAEAELAAAPDDSAGWLHRAYALRRVPDGGLPQAWKALLPAAKKFPDEPIIAYNLACYACQMQRRVIARKWLRRALATGQPEAIRQMALADDDLRPLWSEINNL